MKALLSSYDLNGLVVKNRVVVPPMVCFGYSDEQGLVSEKNKMHYEAFAKGGAGMIVVEASCILPSGRLSLDQLGLWSDEQIEGMREIVKSAHNENSVILVQLHHAGEKRNKTLGEFSVNTLSEEDLESLIKAYIDAAKRAEMAGFDGVELHGAHGYLLCQMASVKTNQRTDAYGGSLDGGLLMAKKIIEGILEACPKFAVVSYRMGADEPDLETGIEIAKKLESYGANLLHVSTGMGGDAKPEVPEDFIENWIVYMGTKVKEAVSIPVTVVNGIRKSEHANELVEKGLADFIALGRPHLVDAFWTDKISNGEAPMSCINCKPCRWFKNGELCPKKANK